MPKWIHDRAEHILAKNPSMPKSEAFAIATQQGHALGKVPKGYGTSSGKQRAKAKYDTPKDDKKMANPNGLKSPRMEKGAYDQFTMLMKQAGVGQTLGGLVKKEAPLLQKATSAVAHAPGVVPPAAVGQTLAGGAKKLDLTGRLAGARVHTPAAAQAVPRGVVPPPSALATAVDARQMGSAIPAVAQAEAAAKAKGVPLAAHVREKLERGVDQSLLKATANSPFGIAPPRQVPNLAAAPASAFGTAAKPLDHDLVLAGHNEEVAGLFKEHSPETWAAISKHPLVASGRMSPTAAAGWLQSGVQQAGHAWNPDLIQQQLSHTTTPGKTVLSSARGNAVLLLKRAVDASMWAELSRLTKTATTTPAARLAKSSRIGQLKSTAPAGPSIAEQSKPVGYGRHEAGANKGII